VHSYILDVTVLGDRNGFPVYYFSSFLLFGGVVMSPLRRRGVNKGKSARKFRGQSKRTKGANMSQVMRGGIRF